MLEAVLFDMDGVIIDTEPFFLRSESMLLKEFGVDTKLEYHFRYQGTTHEYMWETMKNEFDLDAPVGELVERANVIRNRLMEEGGLQPIPGVISFIARLHEAGIPLAIASSSPLTDIQKAVKSLDIEKYFSYFISGESVAHSKPAPDIFLDAAENLKANPENCVVIEDSRNGVASADAETDAYASVSAISSSLRRIYLWQPSSSPIFQISMPITAERWSIKCKTKKRLAH